MKRYDIAQNYLGGMMVESEDGDYVEHDAVAPAVAALEGFISQWNACGPNSAFGRIFQRTYTQAREALAILKGEGCRGEAAGWERVGYIGLDAAQRLAASNIGTTTTITKDSPFDDDVALWRKRA